MAVVADLVKRATRNHFGHQKQPTKTLYCFFNPLPLFSPLRKPAPFYLIYYLKDFAIFPLRGEKRNSLFKMLLCLLQLII